MIQGLDASEKTGGVLGGPPPAEVCVGGRASKSAARSYVPQVARRWKIVDCEPCHLRQLARTLRAEDATEVRALGHPSAMRMLYRTWRASVVRRTALVDGEVAAAWGLLGGGSLMASAGVPWLLTAPAIERVPFDFAREGRREAREMLEIYPLLENYVHAPYRRAVGFLKILGFTIDEAGPILPTGEYFHRFWMSRSS